MSDTVDRVMSLNAQDTVRELAAQGVNLNKIRGALHTSEGVWFKDAEIIACGALFGFTLVPVHSATGTTETSTAAAERRALYSLRPKQTVDKVRLVPPGTYPTPPGGYRIGMSRWS